VIDPNEPRDQESPQIVYSRYDQNAGLPGNALRTRTIILIAIALHILVACDKSTAWPPNRAQLAQVFDQQKATFIVIEEEMVSDDLKRMGPVVFSQMERNPAIPKLPSTQASKYAALFESTQMYLDVTRLERSTAFELLLQNVGPRLYLSRFIHTSIDYALPNCAPAMQQASCGSCSIRLERDWLLEYSWFPANPEDEAREC
jgi:hypothetical protein